MSEAQPEAQPDPDQLTVDQQEASSIRYGVWLRLAVLSSGRWAVYHGTEEGGGLETNVIEIFDSLDVEYLRALSVNEQAKAEIRYRGWRAEFDLRESARATGPQVAKQNLEEMGL